MDKNSRIKLHTGSEMPVMGLGTWQLREKTAETIRYAIEIGYRLIDTSSDYGTHQGIAEAIKNSNVGREDLFITTKVEETDDAYKRVKSNLEELGLDYIDLILIHRPPFFGTGVDLWEGLIRAKNEGLVRDIGVSNYSIPKIEKLIDATGEVPTVNQIEWSPFGFSPDMKEYCDRKGIIVQAYSPLTRTKRLKEPLLEQLAQKYGKAPSQILIRWNLQQRTVPIPKANQKTHLQENLNVFDFEMSKDDIDLLNSLNKNYSSLGSLPYV